MALRIAIDMVGIRRVVFGADGSMLDLMLSRDKWVEAIKNPKPSSPDINFKEMEIETILGKAAERLLKL